MDPTTAARLLQASAAAVAAEVRAPSPKSRSTRWLEGLALADLERSGDHRRSCRSRWATSCTSGCTTIRPLQQLVQLTQAAVWPDMENARRFSER